MQKAMLYTPWPGWQTAPAGSGTVSFPETEAFRALHSATDGHSGSDGSILQSPAHEGYVKIKIITARAGVIVVNIMDEQFKCSFYRILTQLLDDFGRFIYIVPSPIFQQFAQAEQRIQAHPKEE